ncbi:MAG TPA: SMP-30/gluconolactonase/LRE family protein [Bauldia sp.]|nr:SMP-30/gluconolactonase/LRE family protein [Bauldia sp.]
MALVGEVTEIIDRRFVHMINGTAEVERLYDKCRWAEGPVWMADSNQLVWSDIPNSRMLRWTWNGEVSVFRTDSHYSNGNTRDREGRLITCEHGARRVTRTEVDGSITVIADSYKGKRLNSPNDVVVKSDGSIWFTDPSYGIAADYEGHKAPTEQDGCYVFRVDPKSGKITVVADDFVRPNGLAFSPDESILYIADSDAPSHIRWFKVGKEGSLKGGKVFVTTDGVPDGFRIDTDGNMWTSAGAGINVYTPDAEMLGRIRFPHTVANLTFGGPKRNRVFVCCTNELYSFYVMVNGTQRP